ncbi:MAG TPA: mersacidin/lichenicidin family type 2 lantibiotic [Thermoanaerobaculia bacterium]|nr:mersacidin/lichenicidin family type 2 lantibiotic [Thermoanaerobaculia bacterium]
MNKTDVIRAWKDPVYRATLSEEEQAALPQHPSGLTDLSDDQLVIAGASSVVTTAPNCTNYTFLNWRSCCPPITTAVTCTEYTFAGSTACCPTTA